MLTKGMIPAAGLLAHSAGITEVYIARVEEKPQDQPKAAEKPVDKKEDLKEALLKKANVTLKDLEKTAKAENPSEEKQKMDLDHAKTVIEALCDKKIEMPAADKQKLAKALIEQVNFILTKPPTSAEKLQLGIDMLKALEALRQEDSTDTAKKENQALFDNVVYPLFETLITQSTKLPTTNEKLTESAGAIRGQLLSNYSLNPLLLYNDGRKGKVGDLLRKHYFNPDSPPSLAVLRQTHYGYFKAGSDPLAFTRIRNDYGDLVTKDPKFLKGLTEARVKTLQEAKTPEAIKDGIKALIQLRSYMWTVQHYMEQPYWDILGERMNEIKNAPVAKQLDQYLLLVSPSIRHTPEKRIDATSSYGEMYYVHLGDKKDQEHIYFDSFIETFSGTLGTDRDCNLRLQNTLNSLFYIAGLEQDKRKKNNANPERTFEMKQNPMAYIAKRLVDLEQDNPEFGKVLVQAAEYSYTWPYEISVSASDRDYFYKRQETAEFVLQNIFETNYYGRRSLAAKNPKLVIPLLEKILTYPMSTSMRASVGSGLLSLIKDEANQKPEKAPKEGDLDTTFVKLIKELPTYGIRPKDVDVTRRKLNVNSDLPPYTELVLKLVRLSQIELGNTAVSDTWLEGTNRNEHNRKIRDLVANAEMSLTYLLANCRSDSGDDGLAGIMHLVLLRTLQSHVKPDVANTNRAFEWGSFAALYVTAPAGADASKKITPEEFREAKAKLMNELFFKGSRIRAFSGNAKDDQPIPGLLEQFRRETVSDCSDGPSYKIARQQFLRGYMHIIKDLPLTQISGYHLQLRDWGYTQDEIDDAIRLRGK